MKKVRILNGYRVIYEPEHPTCMKNDNWNGYIYEHRYVMEVSLQRSLNENEVVHHLDGNKLNNRLDNLIVLSKEMHAKLHFWIDTGAFIHESYERNGMNSGKSKVTEPTYCKVCDKTLQEKQKNTCSVECNAILKTSPNKPSKEQLQEDINSMSWLAIGKKYGVSDNGARKWAKKYGLL
jgi:predicted nucleic acid-binding Zn ribbon protein